MLVTFVIVKIIRQEITTSKYQARYLSEIAEQLRFKLNPGASKSIRYPSYGPYDERMGYTLVPDAIGRLEKTGFGYRSPGIVLADDGQYWLINGLFPIYQEKTRTGLNIVDQANTAIFSTIYPRPWLPKFRGDSAASSANPVVY